VHPVFGALEVLYVVFAIPALYENAFVNAECSVYNVISNFKISHRILFLALCQLKCDLSNL